MRQKSSILEELFLNKKTEMVLEIYESGEVSFSDLKTVVSNPNYLKKIVDTLENERIISQRKIGKQKLLSPNVIDNVDVYAAIELVRKSRFLKAQKSVAPYLNELVRKANDSAFIVVYGSYASGTHTEESDIDVCIATSSKEGAERIVSEVFSSSRTRAQLLVETSRDFGNANDRLHESIKKIPKNRIVLSGMHNFLSAGYG